MSEPSKKPSSRRKKPDPELPDDEAIRRLFPKRVVDSVNRDIEYEPKKPSKPDKDKDKG